MSFAIISDFIYIEKISIFHRKIEIIRVMIYMRKMSIVNPKTGKKIKKGGKVFSDLLNEGYEESQGILIKRDIQSLMVKYNVPGVSIALIKNGKVQTKCYGVKSAGESGKITKNTLFQAASLSKPIIAFGILLLVQNGKLDLDTDVNKYLTSWKVSEHYKVTIRGILSHTAGLNRPGFPGYTFKDRIPTVIEVLDGMGNTEAVKVIAEPGTQDMYSGGGYVILQVLIEDVTHVTFEKYMTYVLTSLGMTNSTFGQPKRNMASGHWEDGSPIEGGYRIHPEKAPAGLWSTPSDLAKYVIAVQKCYRTGGLLRRDICKQMLTPITLNDGTITHRGLGLVIVNKDSSVSFNHTGSNKGFVSRLSGIISNDGLDNGMVIMANGYNGLIINEIRDILNKA
jgi:CubicO group peptidase (beta-lactamase class C family)